MGNIVEIEILEQGVKYCSSVSIVNFEHVIVDWVFTKFYLYVHVVDHKRYLYVHVANKCPISVYSKFSPIK